MSSFASQTESCSAAPPKRLACCALLCLCQATRHSHLYTYNIHTEANWFCVSAWTAIYKYTHVCTVYVKISHLYNTHSIRHQQRAISIHSHTHSQRNVSIILRFCARMRFKQRHNNATNEHIRYIRQIFISKLYTLIVSSLCRFGSHRDVGLAARRLPRGFA